MEERSDPMHGDVLAGVEFADNPEPRCAVALVLDTSGSMHGRAIAELNAGLQSLATALKADTLASLRVEIGVLTFGGGVRVLDPAGGATAPADPADAFTTVDRFVAPTLVADGETPMGEAVGRALALLRARKERYRANGIDYFRPWLLLVTDGRPTDRGWEAAADEARAEEGRRGVSLYAVGVEGADMRTLARFCGEDRPPLKLAGLAFNELFTWLSKSLSAVSQSRPGDQTPLPPVGWAVADTSH